MEKEHFKKLLMENRAMDVLSQGHIMEIFRDDLDKAGFIDSRRLRWKENDQMARLAGRLIIIHTPPTRSKKRVMFLTMEDEEGLFDLTVFEDIQRKYAKKIMSHSILLIEGQINRFGLRGISVVVKKVWSLKEFYQKPSV